MFDIPELYTRLGTYRAYHLAAILFISAFLAGYDSGVAGGILTFKPFENDFHYGSSREKSVDSLTVGLEQLGSFCASIATYPLTNRYGRKYVLIGSSAIFVLGAMLETINTGSRGAWYTARIIAGIGMGGQSVVVPMYSAEMTPKEIRGRCGSFYQWMYTWGVFAAYWVDYGVERNAAIAATSREWQIPVGLQLVSGGILLLGTFTLPESIRWLLTKGRTEEAWKSIAWIRGDEGERTLAEFRETQLGIRAESVERENFQLRELWQQPANRLRLLVGASLFVFQNATGSSALAVFGPEYFELIVGDNEQRDLLLTGLFGAVKVIACSFFIFTMAERFGRRSLLVGGSLFMASCMLITTLILKLGPPTSSTHVSNAGRATVAMIYLNIMAYNCSWGPVPWAYVPEIFPTRIRAIGLATSMLAHWATSFCFSFASPYMIDNIGSNTFFIFMSFDLLAAVFCWFFVRETRGKNLENATGIEWEVAEKEPGLSGGSSPNDPEAGEKVLVDSQGHQVQMVAVRDTYGFGGKGRM